MEDWQTHQAATPRCHTLHDGMSTLHKRMTRTNGWGWIHLYEEWCTSTWSYPQPTHSTRRQRTSYKTSEKWHPQCGGRLHRRYARLTLPTANFLPRTVPTLNQHREWQYFVWCTFILRDYVTTNESVEITTTTIKTGSGSPKLFVLQLASVCCLSCSLTDWIHIQLDKWAQTFLHV